MPITKVPSFTKVPDRGSAPAAAFSEAVDTFLGEINTRTVAGNQQADELNALAAQVETQAQAVAQGKASFDEGYAAFLAALGAEVWLRLRWLRI
ncbi:hypothetical protein [Phaeobacter sp.]|uniref:hypothetical protein n=1 Tax=Phaeobacter sp. TaxID=1902409 RepID=UPI0025F8C10D|nr:hypothetical protein [Phaeobacter sp.]